MIDQYAKYLILVILAGWIIGARECAAARGSRARILAMVSLSRIEKAGAIVFGAGSGWRDLGGDSRECQPV